MAIVGAYDASTFVDGDYSTYPALPVGIHYYQIGMGWVVVVAGTVQGQDVSVGDLLFAVPRPRLYGDYSYGEKYYGSRSAEDNDWTVDELYFLKWDASLQPPDQVPYPNSGCPFTPEHGFGGVWAPGWRIVVECYYDQRINLRTYGDLAYGDQVYGDRGTITLPMPVPRDYGDLTYGDDVYGTTNSLVEVPWGGPRWVDITQPSFHIEIGDGMADGGPRVVVSELVVSFYDPAGRWFDMATPLTWHQPQPGTPIRVGLVDPLYRYYPLITGEIERIEDTHAADGPREVMVRGFGKIMDLVVDLPGVQRPAEPASARFNWLANAAGWTWDTAQTPFPPGDSTLLADRDVRPMIVARDEMDRTCHSVGWFLDSTREGRMRVRHWPHEPETPVLRVADCYDANAVVSHSISFANDESQLLNYVITTNTADPQGTIIGEDQVSVARFHRRGRAHNFPMTGLAWSDPAAAGQWASRVLARYAYITRQVESFEVDTGVDRSWLPTLVDLDTGRGVQIERTTLAPLRIDGVIVGWRWRLDPGRWQGTVFVATSTPSM